MDALVHGEHLAVSERMVVAPVVGVYRTTAITDGQMIDAGDAIGFVDGPGTATPVRSPFRGELMGMLAHAGERLREGQPVAWLRVA